MKNAWWFILNCVVSFSIGLCMAAAASAQVTTGTILGAVTDSAGQVVPGAQVTITEVGKDNSRQLTTDDSGDYTLPFLIPGTYTISVEKAGFKRYVRSGVILQLDQSARIDVTLEVGELSETTTVVGAAPLVDTENASIGEVIEERSIRELPLNGRNFATLVYLAPGITPGQANENLSGASTFNPRGASNFNALGHHANSNAWLIDGIDNNEYTFNTVIVTPSVESIREFKVLTGTFSAEFGRGAGIVSVSTKSGSNDFHGTVFEFLRNDVFDARNYFSPKSRVPKKPPFRRNQFGFALSGPVTLPRFGEGGPAIWSGKNKTFFFGDYSGLREVRGLSFVNTVPTAKTRVGDFSEYVNPTTGQLIPIYNPFTTRPDPNNPGRFIRDQFPNNRIPLELLNRVGLNIASINPLPNAPGNFNNYFNTTNRVVEDDAVTIRLDHKFGEEDTVFVRYSYDTYKLDAPQGQAACCLPTPPEAAARFDLGPFVAGIQNTRLKTHGAAVNYTHIFNASTVNELRLGWARTAPFTFQSDFGRRAAESLGINGINVSEFTTGLPNINIQEFTGLSGGPAFLPVNPRQNHYQFEDNLYWTRGNHQLKFGYRLVHRLVSPFTNTDTRSTITFNNNFTNNPANNTGGTGLATLLLGFPTAATRGFLFEPYYMTNKEHAAFIQDDIKINRRLTLNIGLRYEVYQPDVEERDRLVNYDPVGMRLIYAGENGVSRTAGKETRWGNIGPRLGFAWDIFGDSTTVGRGGFGISHFPEPHSASNLLGQQVPYTVSQNYNPATSPLGSDFTNLTLRTIADPFPPIQVVKPRTTAELNAANPRILGHDLENLTPYAESYSLGIQRQLTSSIVFEIDYVGSRGIHIPIFYNINEVQPGTGSQASRRLIQPLSNVGTLLVAQNRNMSTYHSMQTKLEKRFSDGLQFLVSYTFGKVLDYGGSAASGGGSVGNPQTYTNISAGRGPAGYDVKHRAVISYVYEFPFGRDRKWLNDSSVANAVIGGWQLTGITTLTTGRPFTVFLNQGVNNGAPSWPNRIGPGELSNPDPFLWFNPNDFAAPPANTYGNSARGVLYSPGHTNFDIALSKNIPFSERVRGQFRFDAFNLFNTPSFAFPNANIGSPTAGRITSTLNDNRILQFALKLDW